jgi:hypothetical protein
MELFGINFNGKKDVRNLMLQYGDSSDPFKKLFPTIGLKEMVYDIIRDLLVQLNSNTAAAPFLRPPLPRIAILPPPSDLPEMQYKVASCRAAPPCFCQLLPRIATLPPPGDLFGLQ